MKKLPIEFIQEIFELRAADKVLLWRTRSEEFFKTKPMADYWNRRFSGKPALTSVGTGGYAGGLALGVIVRRSRIVYALKTGKHPRYTVDHIDGNITNDHPDNLRDITHLGNMKNKRMAKNNKSGITGVFWNKREKKWHAQISAGGKTVFLGHFVNKDDAAAARGRANKIYGYTDRHGL